MVDVKIEESFLLHVVRNFCEIGIFFFFFCRRLCVASTRSVFGDGNQKKVADCTKMKILHALCDARQTARGGGARSSNNCNAHYKWYM